MAQERTWLPGHYAGDDSYDEEIDRAVENLKRAIERVKKARKAKQAHLNRLHALQKSGDMIVLI